MKTKHLILLLLFSFAINVKAQTTSMATGSGIVLSTDGYIATNNHVVDGGIEFFVDVFTNGIKKSYKASVIKTDETNDLAIIKINDPTFKNFSILPYSLRMQGINVGEKVFAMGYPRPGLQGEEVKVTDGIISSKTGFQNDNKTYQISAPIQPGNSGGPLFDNSANLIGLTNAGIPSGENVGYAIKISNLNNLLDMIPDFPAMPLKTAISDLPFTEKVKILSNYTVLIRVIVPNCDLKTPSELFYKINSNSTLQEISNLFNSEGNNYRTDGTGISFYRWGFCENPDTWVDCWFLGNRIHLSMKSFKNETCNSNLNDEVYKLIKPGLSYSSVCKILQGEGDKYRTDHGSNINMYKWFDCNNENLYFDVWFLNGKVHLVRKGDISQEKALLGK
jgi:hypothetical protein